MSGVAKSTPLPPLPFDEALWEAVKAKLALGPQQGRIAELVLRGLGDKEIGAELGIRRSTLRGYVVRLHHRLEVAGRVQLVVALCKAAMEVERERLTRPL